jgi:hypothetical protein
MRALGAIGSAPPDDTQKGSPRASNCTSSHTLCVGVLCVVRCPQVQYYTLRGSRIDPKEWELILGRNLLKASEKSLIEEYSGYKPFLPLVWALAEVENALIPELLGSLNGSSQVRAA